MDGWLIIVLLGGGILLGLRLWLGPADDAPAGLDPAEESFSNEHYEPEPWEAEALVRYGTETSIDQLVSEGRADELRGLGYDGDLPEE